MSVLYTRNNDSVERLNICVSGTQKIFLGTGSVYIYARLKEYPLGRSIYILRSAVFGHSVHSAEHLELPLDAPSALMGS